MKGKKLQKFHETLVGMLYPPEETLEPDEGELDLAATVTRGLDKDLDEDNDSEKSNSSSDMDGTVVQKLTRAQRKSLKRKKLKESAANRRKIIGPLLPPPPTCEHTQDGPSVLIDNEPTLKDSTCGMTHALETSPKIGRPMVQCIPSKASCISEESDACLPQNKIRRRRIAKRSRGNTLGAPGTCLI